MEPHIQSVDTTSPVGKLIQEYADKSYSAGLVHGLALGLSIGILVSVIVR